MLSELQSNINLKMHTAFILLLSNFKYLNYAPHKNDIDEEIVERIVTLDKTLLEDDEVRQDEIDTILRIKESIIKIAKETDEDAAEFDQLILQFESINFLQILYNFSKSIDFLFDDDFVRKDMYFAIKNVANAPDENFFDEQITTYLDTEAENLVDQLQISNAKCSEFDKFDHKNLDAEEYGIYQAWSFASFWLYENLLNAITK